MYENIYKELSGDKIYNAYSIPSIPLWVGKETVIHEGEHGEYSEDEVIIYEVCKNFIFGLISVIFIILLEFIF